MGEQPLFPVAALKDEVGICANTKKEVTQVSAEDNTGDCHSLFVPLFCVTVTFKNGSSSHRAIITVVYPSKI